MRSQILVLLGAVVSLIEAQGYNGYWDAAYAKEAMALGKLSTVEKAGLVTGIGWEKVSALEMPVQRTRSTSAHYVYRMDRLVFAHRLVLLLSHRGSKRRRHGIEA